MKKLTRHSILCLSFAILVILITSYATVECARYRHLCNESQRLQEEFPPQLVKPLPAELQDAIVRVATENPEIVGELGSDEMSELLQSFGMSADVAGILQLLSQPIDTGSAKLDYAAAVMRRELLGPEKSSIYANGTRDFAVEILYPVLETPPANLDGVQLVGVYENRNGKLYAYTLKLFESENKEKPQDE